MITWASPGTLGFGPYSFLSGSLSSRVKTRRMSPPIRGTNAMKYHQPLFPMSWRRRIVTAREGTKSTNPYADITPISRKYPTLVAPDGLHPSAEMYAKWVTVILPRAEAALQGH